MHSWIVEINFENDIWNLHIQFYNVFTARKNISYNVFTARKNMTIMCLLPEKIWALYQLQNNESYYQILCSCTLWKMAL